MKALVTGAAGFIGSHLCRRLLNDNWQVTGLDNFDPFYDRAVKQSNFADFTGNENFTFIEGDIRDPKTASSAVQNADYIIHLAAKAGVRPSIADPAGYVDTNINGTVTMLQAARSADIKNFIFASSSSVYGNNRKIPFAENDNVDYPISPYAATKKAGELICHTYSHLYDMNITCLRFFTVYGPAQRPDLAIHKFARLIESHKPIPVFGDGSMRRDFTYIDDIIDGIIAAVNNMQGYEIYNLGESRPVRLDELIAAVETALGKQAVIERLPDQPGDVKQTYADVAKAMAALGYRPKTKLSEGLKKFVTWLRSQPKNKD